MDQLQIAEALTLGSARLATNDEEGDAIRASNIASCRRMLGLRLAGMEPNAITGKQARIFQAGHDQGRQMAQALVAGLPNLPVYKQEAICWYPTPGEKGFAIYGHADLLIRQGGRSILFEFKTAHEFKLKMLAKEGPSDNYVAQTLLYKLALKADEAWLIHANRNDLSIKPDWIFRIDEKNPDQKAILDTALANAALAMSEHERGYIVGHQMAPRLKDDTAGTHPLPWQCNYCQFGPLRGKCYPEDALVPRKKGDLTEWHVTIHPQDPDLAEVFHPTPIEEVLHGSNV